MKTEEENYKRSISPVPRSNYNDLVNIYEFSIKLLSLRDPSQWLKQFFKGKGVSKLFCCGRSHIGGKIVSLILDEIVCVNEQNSNPKECGAAFILNSDAAGIGYFSTRLKEQGVSAIYNLYDIRNELMRQNP